MKKRFYSKELKERVVNLSHQRENIKELADKPEIRAYIVYI